MQHKFNLRHDLNNTYLSPLAATLFNLSPTRFWQKQPRNRFLFHVLEDRFVTTLKHGRWMAWWKKRRNYFSNNGEAIFNNMVRYPGIKKCPTREIERMRSTPWTELTWSSKSPPLPENDLLFRILSATSSRITMSQQELRREATRNSNYIVFLFWSILQQYFLILCAHRKSQNTPVLINLPYSRPWD